MTDEPAETAREALDRTLLVMRRDLAPDAPDDRLLGALTGVRVALAADAEALATASGQSAFVAAALTMARSGHEVWLQAAETAMVGAQPPLAHGPLLASLVAAGEALIPGVGFRLGAPEGPVDLAVLLGTPGWTGEATQVCALNADDWCAWLSASEAPWRGRGWPLGAVAAGALAAGEGFKAAMRGLRDLARAPAWFDELYAPCPAAEIRLAPEGTPKLSTLGEFDVVSGGAIGNALFFILLRLPEVTGLARAIDDDRSALSNLNRNALLLRTALREFKVDDLARLGGGLEITPEPVRFEAGMALARIVLIGVDHIPSRWAAQATDPDWLGVGATSDFSVQVSGHAPGRACARCLHPEDAPPGGPIPTVALVSLWAGLLLAVRFLREAAGTPPPVGAQQIFFTALRPESWADADGPIPRRAVCPTCEELAANRAVDTRRSSARG